MAETRKIVITGAAGLVGQNLLPRLRASAGTRVVAIDKNEHNLAILARLHPDVDARLADLAQPGSWEDALVDCDALVVCHAQIGGLRPEEFVRNNVTATERLMAEARAKGVRYVVNISSSVVNSMAKDNYTETKKAQEATIKASGIPQVVLRPTLMFGWFDRKHLGWLARFMKRVPIFPIPGSGRYMRQPLYAGDFCEIVAAAIERRIEGEYNISGLERIDYIDLMRAVKRATRSRAAIVRIPFALFRAMLDSAALIAKDPPFTSAQLKALATPDEFEVIDWPQLFGVRATPLAEALDATFNDPVYSDIVLQF